MIKVAILQSNYIPWKGYFDIIASVDTFIIYDEVQYTKNDWRNRNIIRTREGTAWLTVPVSFNFGDTILGVKMSDPRFSAKHWKTLNGNYARAPYFKEVAEWLKPIYDDEPGKSLSKWNVKLIQAICTYLGIKAEFVWSHTIATEPGKSVRLVELCRAVGADTYVSGSAAKAYLETERFEEKNIRVEWYDYSNYPEYPQNSGPFTHQVSILDLLFNCGPDATLFMKMGDETHSAII